MNDLSKRIAENVAGVREQIAQSAAQSGRTADDVTLVAVTKYVGADETRALVEAGCVNLGESRPQHLVPKAEALADLDLRWHMIGHLQRNKVRRTLPVVHLVHSVDSPVLASAIDRIAGELGIGTRVLLEINVSGDADKHGIGPDEAEPLLAEMAQLPNLQVCGLMAMAGLRSSDMDARREFAALRELRDRLSANCPDGVALDELSMGMSGDYPMAIEEGATLVRVGSALFEGVRP